jgi:lysine N6-hydroxylase
MVSTVRSLARNHSSTGHSSVERHYRCVGIGVGPANLSLASLLYSHPEVPNLFLDKKDRFGWHDGQQIPDTSMQTSLFKDLVLLSDPTSSFSFLSYLHEQRKIYHFVNAQFDAIPRKEFRSYLEWVSRRNENIVFGEEVVAVEFDRSFVLYTNKRILTAENIAIGVGSQPWVPPPEQGKLGETQFHTTDFVNKAHGLGGKRVAVIGGGQSGAEVFLDLISRPANERPRRVIWIPPWELLPP